LVGGVADIDCVEERDQFGGGLAGFLMDLCEVEDEKVVVI
jgi:hypothetical protein